MATVIQEKQRSNTDRHPRWVRSQRAALFDQYRELQAKGLSLRQAAKALDVPRSTLQAWRAYQESLDEHPAVVAFFHSAPGLAFLHRLVLGIHLVCTEVGACGIRLVCLLVKLTGLDRFVAASYGAQHQVNRQVEEAIVAYRQEESARLAKAMPAKAITLAKDETFTGGLCLVAIEPKSNYIVLEQEAHARDQDTWQALMAQALAGLNCQVIQSTSDEAPGLLAYVEHALGVHHSPDLFHVQHELVKAVCGPMATKQRAAGKAATEAQERLERGQGQLQGAGDAPAKRGSGRPPKAIASLEQLEREAQAANQEFERISAQRERAGRPEHSSHRSGLPLCRCGARGAAKRPAHCGRYPSADGHHSHRCAARRPQSGMRGPDRQSRAGRSENEGHDRVCFGVCATAGPSTRLDAASVLRHACPCHSLMLS
jgi:helix-turn-helix, Psq domain